MAEYTDGKNNTYRIIHLISPSDEERENRILEDLYKIFAK